MIFEIRDEKLHYNIDKEAAKISGLSSGTIDKRDILQVKIYQLPPSHKRVIEKANFTNSPLRKAFKTYKSI